MQVLNFVDGAFQNTPQVLENVTPSTGAVFGTIPRSGAAEVDQAMAAAKRAFPHGRRPRSQNVPPVWNGWRTPFGTMPMCWPKRKPATTASPCRSLRTWTFPVPKRTCVSTRPEFSIMPAKATPWKARRSTTRCASRWALWRASARGICPCTCSRGKWPQRLLQATVWSPNPLNSRL